MGKRKVPGMETLRELMPVVGFARAHLAGIVLSILLMALQAGANTGRIVLLYPILTRVLLAPAEKAVPRRPAPDEPEAAREAGGARRRDGPVEGARRSPRVHHRRD